ncbi:MAG: hypothetical protein IK124_04805 [Prevotella sp.]|nr:hypothetical protein [Prevotella sp.]
MKKLLTIITKHSSKRLSANPENGSFEHRPRLIQSQEYGWGYLFSVGIPSLLSSKIDNDWHALIEDHLHVDEVFSVDKHLTRWFEVNANQKAEKYFRKKGIPWKYEEYPVNIDRIIDYYYKKNN